jgi:hypothetical protein
MGEHAARCQILMSALVVIDFETYIKPGECLDDCSIFVAQPYYDAMGCEFSLAGLEDVSRSMMLAPFPFGLFCALSMSSAPVPYPIQQHK